ncbi:MAG: GT-D fold domain-containing glycosyltransferase [Syntrophomonas sp.]
MRNKEGLSSMYPFVIEHYPYVELPEVIEQMRYCLDRKTGFSLVRIGDGENIVMAQGLVYSEEAIRNYGWTNNEDYTGIVLPNYEAISMLIAGVKTASVVGVLHQTEAFEWRYLTERVFSAYDVRPRQLCYAGINLYMPNNPHIIDLIKNHRVLLIGKTAPVFGDMIYQKFNTVAVGSIIINNFFDISRVLHQATDFDYELALISAGSNAVILAPLLAQLGKVAIDFGSAMSTHLWY